MSELLQITNRFGQREHLMEIPDGDAYIICPACISVWADGLGMANEIPDRIVDNPWDADNIIILCCQVTDLAVYADICIMEEMHEKFPCANIIVSGCLAQRADIELPDYVQTMILNPDTPFIRETWTVDMAIPFWANEWNEHANPYSDGHLFRGMYPIRSSAGCSKNCSYCTIKDTRGKHHRHAPDLQGFLGNDNCVLVADSPSVSEVAFWCGVASGADRKISLRNVEPNVAVECETEILELARRDLLSAIHIPVQAWLPQVLESMNRSASLTHKAVELVSRVRNLSPYTIAATNVIYDYPLNDKIAENCVEIDHMLVAHPTRNEFECFNVINWNPFWNGVWSPVLAAERFERYLKRPRPAEQFPEV